MIPLSVFPPPEHHVSGQRPRVVKPHSKRFGRAACRRLASRCRTLSSPGFDQAGLDWYIYFRFYFRALLLFIYHINKDDFPIHSPWNGVDILHLSSSTKSLTPSPLIHYPLLGPSYAPLSICSVSIHGITREPGLASIARPETPFRVSCSLLDIPILDILILRQLSPSNLRLMFHWIYRAGGSTTRTAGVMRDGVDISILNGDNLVMLDRLYLPFLNLVLPCV